MTCSGFFVRYYHNEWNRMSRASAWGPMHLVAAEARQKLPDESS